jgi:hypothetical protein
MLEGEAEMGGVKIDRPSDVGDLVSNAVEAGLESAALL